MYEGWRDRGELSALPRDSQFSALLGSRDGDLLRAAWDAVSVEGGFTINRKVSTISLYIVLATGNTPYRCSRKG